MTQPVDTNEGNYALPRPDYQMIAYNRRIRWPWAVGGGLLLGVVVLWAASFGFEAYSGTRDGLQLAGSISGILAVITLASCYALRSSLYAEDVEGSYRPYLAELASRAQLSMDAGGTPSFDPQYVPAVSPVRGARAVVLTRVAGVIGGTPTSFELTRSDTRLATDASGRRHDLVFRIRLARQLPHTIAIPWLDGGDVVTTTLERGFDDNQRVALEGDLDRFFQFYTHRRTVTDALSFWTPSELWELRVAFQYLGELLVVETIGSDLYVSLRAAPLQATETLERYIALCEKLARRARLSVRAKDPLELPNSAKYPYLRSREDGGVVKVGGLRLPLISVGLVAVLVFAGVRFFGIWGLSLPFWVAMVLTVAAAVGAGLFAARRSAYTETRDKRGY